MHRRGTPSTLDDRPRSRKLLGFHARPLFFLEAILFLRSRARYTLGKSSLLAFAPRHAVLADESLKAEVRVASSQEFEEQSASAIDFAANPEVVRVVAEGYRLGYGHLFNPAFATEISLIDPVPHQRIAVCQYMLPQPRLRFLLADEPGAGKTIMAGLYIRRDARPPPAAPRVDHPSGRSYR
jgi:hypothetical protein